MSAPKHPMQPFVHDSDGRVRFKENAIVRYLLDRDRENFNLNNLAIMPFNQDDWVQFYQLIGYSLKGFHELSGVPDGVCIAASKAARKQLYDPGLGGCRDEGCDVHCGVEEETEK